MIFVAIFAAVGISAAVWLAGAPDLRVPRVDSEVLETATNLGARLACALCGAVPLTMLSLAYIHMARLTVLLGMVVLPAYGAAVAIGWALPDIWNRAITGFLAGVVAVLAYDVVRLALSYSQGLHDPIPHIGVMLAGQGAPWWLGYVWRTFGNGAGLGLAYVMLCPRPWWGPKTGILYGTVVGVGMIAFLAVFPVAQSQLFPLSWQTVVNGMIGHWTYGAVLGSLARAYRERQDAVRRQDVRARWAGVPAAFGQPTGGRHAKKRHARRRGPEREEVIMPRPVDLDDWE